MRARRTKIKPVIYKNAPEHSYKKYESYPYRKRIDKGISDVVQNQDLVEREARKYIDPLRRPICAFLELGRV
jgi:hypothetical protein